MKKQALVLVDRHDNGVLFQVCEKETDTLWKRTLYYYSYEGELVLKQSFNAKRRRNYRNIIKDLHNYVEFTKRDCRMAHDFGLYSICYFTLKLDDFGTNQYGMPELVKFIYKATQ